MYSNQFSPFIGSSVQNPIPLKALISSVKRYVLCQREISLGLGLVFTLIAQSTLATTYFINIKEQIRRYKNSFNPFFIKNLSFLFQKMTFNDYRN